MADNSQDQDFDDQLDMLSAVGLGISSWANVESGLVMICSKVLGALPHKTGVVLYSITNFYTWLAIIDELIRISPKNTAQRKKWNKLNTRLRSLNDTRVRLAHHTIFTERTATIKPARFDTRSKSKRYEPLSGREIAEFSTDTLKISDDLRAFLKRLKMQIP